jgi:hypothetical protein
MVQDQRVPLFIVQLVEQQHELSATQVFIS